MAAPPRILLINPNSSEVTTAMMVAIASSAIEPRCKVVGATAIHLGQTSDVVEVDLHPDLRAHLAE
jgi:Asp/Glu/hydantoin racemase